jgi:hypothetical protein
MISTLEGTMGKREYTQSWPCRSWLTKVRNMKYVVDLLVQFTVISDADVCMDQIRKLMDGLYSSQLAESNRYCPACPFTSWLRLRSSSPLLPLNLHSLSLLVHFWVFGLFYSSLSGKDLHIHFILFDDLKPRAPFTTFIAKLFETPSPTPL